MANMELIIVKGGIGYDAKNLVSKVNWSGRKGTAARTLAVNFMDDGGYQHDRTGIDPEEGHQCGFYWKGKELFRGIILKSGNTFKKMSCTAYDVGISLSNNKDSFSYTNMTATQIFLDLCARIGIQPGNVADTKHIIPELPKPKTTYLDVLLDALSQTYKATGQRFFPVAQEGKLHLIERKQEVLHWVLEIGGNIQDFNYSKSLENTKTRLRLLSENGTVIAEHTNAALEQKIGIFQDVEVQKDTLNQAQLQELLNTMVQEKGAANQSLSITAVGIPDVYAGKCVYISIPEINISRVFYVEADTHTFVGEKHTMQVTLNFAADIAAIE